jgi:hypothetical protein
MLPRLPCNQLPPGLHIMTLEPCMSYEDKVFEIITA